MILLLFLQQFEDSIINVNRLPLQRYYQILLKVPIIINILIIFKIFYSKVSQFANTFAIYLSLITCNYRFNYKFFISIVLLVVPRISF